MPVRRATAIGHRSRRACLRNSTQPEPPSQTGDSIPERRLDRRTYSLSPASVFDAGRSSNEVNYPNGVLGRFALLGTGLQVPNQPAPLDDQEERANLRALDAQLSNTGSIRDAVALYLARKAS